MSEWQAVQPQPEYPAVEDAAGGQPIEGNPFMDRAWLIEMTAGPRPLWYTGEDILSADANEAIRFSTKKRATQVLHALRQLRPRQSSLNLDWDCYAITEHKWSAEESAEGASATRSVEAPDVGKTVKAKSTQGWGGPGPGRDGGPGGAAA